MPTAKRDYYEVLGVASDADLASIERAFHALALRYHPDRNKDPDASKHFKEASEAYAVLSDPDKRRQYDAGGFAGVAGYSHDELFGGLDLNSLFAGHNLDFGSGLFDGLFGRRRPAGPRKGQHIEVELTVPLERILHGGDETVHVVRPQTCDVCQGSGAKPGSKPRSCEACHGTGQHLEMRHAGNTTVQQITVCQACRGKGQIIDEPCSACDGRGTTEQAETLMVKLPPGIDEGGVLRLAGRGHPSPDRDGVPGDVLVIVTSEDDPRFQRRGTHLWRAETIEVADAVLGTTVSVPTLDGEAQVTIPPGTQPGQVLRLRGNGLPRYGSDKRGDLYLVVRVRLPDKLSDAERALYERLHELRHQPRQETIE